VLTLSFLFKTQKDETNNKDNDWMIELLWKMPKFFALKSKNIREFFSKNEQVVWILDPQVY
jgi:hypothetical protein